MALIRIQERIKKGVKVLAQSQPAGKEDSVQPAPTAKSEVPTAFRPAWALGPVKPKVKRAPQNVPKPLAAQQTRKPYPAHQHRAQAQAKIQQHQADPRYSYEREKLLTTQNLEQVADDVEAEATLYEWQAQEHGYAPTSARWFIILAAAVTIAAGLLAFLGNILGALAVVLVGGTIYLVAQRQPDSVRYRIMVDGIAINDRLYPYKDLQAFNIVYKPGEVKTVIVRSQKVLSPFIQMEIGNADPVEIRDVLLEFLQEDLDMQEPLTDTWARRFGF